MARGISGPRPELCVYFPILLCEHVRRVKIEMASSTCGAISVCFGMLVFRKRITRYYCACDWCGCDMPAFTSVPSPISRQPSGCLALRLRNTHPASCHRLDYNPIVTKRNPVVSPQRFLAPELPRSYHVLVPQPPTRALKPHPAKLELASRPPLAHLRVPVLPPRIPRKQVPNTVMAMRQGNSTWGPPRRAGPAPRPAANSRPRAHGFAVQ